MELLGVSIYAASPLVCLVGLIEAISLLWYLEDCLDAAKYDFTIPFSAFFLSSKLIFSSYYCRGDSTDSLCKHGVSWAFLALSFSKYGDTSISWCIFSSDSCLIGWDRFWSMDMKRLRWYAFMWWFWWVWRSMTIFLKALSSSLSYSSWPRSALCPTQPAPFSVLTLSLTISARLVALYLRLCRCWWA